MPKNKQKIPPTTPFFRRAILVSSSSSIGLKLLILSLFLCQPSVAVAESDSSSERISSGVQLGARNLVSAASLVILSGCLGLTLLYNLQDIAIMLLQAAARCTIQLYLIGGMLMTHLFVMANAHPWLVAVWMIAASTLAGYEAAARVEYVYPNMMKDLVFSIMIGCVSVMSMAALLRTFGPIKPWFSARTWIPISGMLFGGVLTAVSLAVATWTRELVTRRALIEWRLSRGASLDEALSSVIHATFKTALTPTINSLSVTGIIHLPGMLTGQLLAGQSPYQAVAYQIMIFFLLAASSSTSVQIAMRLVLDATVDATDERLSSLEKLVHATKTQKSVVEAFGLQSIFTRARRLLGSRINVESSDDECIADDIDSTTPSLERHVMLQRPQQKRDGNPLLRVEKMLVERSKLKVSFDVYPGDRIALTGPSGIGKSQLLRTIVGLEHTENRWDHIKMMASTKDILNVVGQSTPSMPNWRRFVALVPQDRPALEGTPREFFEEAHQYESQRLKISPSEQMMDPFSIASEWGITSSMFDQPWTTLSGGEAQRVSLAIALALNPEVILLDEISSALDEAAALKVEETLKRMNIPILMVSHSKAQIDRFCSHAFDLTV